MFLQQNWANISRKLLFFPRFGTTKEWYWLKKKYFSFAGIPRPRMARIHNTSNHFKILGLRLNNNFLLIKKFQLKKILQACSRLNNIFLINWKKKCFSQFIHHFNCFTISNYYSLYNKKQYKKKKFLSKHLSPYKKKQFLMINLLKLYKNKSLNNKLTLQIPFLYFSNYMRKFYQIIKKFKRSKLSPFLSYKFPYNVTNKTYYKISLYRISYLNWLFSSLYGGIVKIMQLGYFNHDPNFRPPKGHHLGNRKIFAISGNLSYIRFLRKKDWNLVIKWLRQREGLRRVTSKWPGKVRKNYRWRRKIRRTKNWSLGLSRWKKKHKRRHIRSINYSRRWVVWRTDMLKKFKYHRRRHRRRKETSIKFFKPVLFRRNFKGLHKKRNRIFLKWEEFYEESFFNQGLSLKNKYSFLKLYKKIKKQDR